MIKYEWRWFIFTAIFITWHTRPNNIEWLPKPWVTLREKVPSDMGDQQRLSSACTSTQSWRIYRAKASHTAYNKDLVALHGCTSTVECCHITYIWTASFLTTWPIHVQVNSTLDLKPCTSVICIIYQDYFSISGKNYGINIQWLAIWASTSNYDQTTLIQPSLYSIGPGSMFFFS